MGATQGVLWEISKWLLLLVLMVMTLAIQFPTVMGYRDSVFDYVSFKDTDEWDDVYMKVCRENQRDEFREPRVDEYEDLLKAPHESKSPVIIESRKTIKSKDTETLHIFNNPGIRNGYSVSYGFQRNKECIRGQDPDCVVSPDFGRVRALVVNAERFKDGQDLNYIKDHFLIEEPEKLATIINGGSQQERKFYEAVFLGGYGPRITGNHIRSSHQIDGKTWPMEIYMYFVDESVPSISLTTILVVLVEESKVDNPYIKPIISSIKNHLYDKERRFLANKGYLQRREKLLHHLEDSLSYDITNKEKRIRSKKSRQLLMETIESSAKYERMMSQMHETYEQMQALDSTLRLIKEDEENADKQLREANNIFALFIHRSPNKKELLALAEEPRFPYDYTELHKIAFAAITHYKEFKPPGFGKYNFNDTYCEDYLFDSYQSDKKGELYFNYLNNFNKYYSNEIQNNSPKHTEEYKKIFLGACNSLVAYWDWLERNYNQTRMKDLSVAQKYADVKDFQGILHQFKLMNQQVYSHFFVDNSEAGHANDTVRPKFEETIYQREFVSNVLKMSKVFKERKVFEEIESDLEKQKADIGKNVGFTSTKDVDDILEYLKYEIKSTKKKRDIIHDATLRNFLPLTQKRRGLPEFGNMNMKEEEIEEMKHMSPHKVLVDQAFQISWLIPPHGGYYHYKGSSPLPPCFRAQNVIVFKKPITMSRHQIEILTTIPTSFNRQHDIKFTAPILHNLRFMVHLQAKSTTPSRFEEVLVPVYNQPRNHLFLGHDGVHKNAVEEDERRKSKEKSNRSSFGAKGQPLVLYFTLITQYYLLVNYF